ncbi:methyltransferase [Motilimonas eburnea]|uniref:methyltransferase n=1 Tax=Motilimonas eburnea TaxID=1737488 RepID=UPI001E3F7D5A|nr:methyltransferase [Motilimonas eburnea]MCE2571755.1 methyltransferase [Motilimonas eburnea]
MFFTPKSRAQAMAEKANLKAGGRVLEPSAGHGALINAALAIAPDSDIVAVELNTGNAKVLKSKEGIQLHNADFLTLTPSDLGLFDSILINPPFTKNQDIKHILHAAKFMAPNSTLVAIASTSWLTGSQKIQEGFRLWLGVVGATIEELPVGEIWSRWP